MILTIFDKCRKAATMRKRTGQPYISIMTQADIAFAVRMTEAERWGYLRHDFENLIGFEPAGCFIARDGGRPVGIVTSTSYGTYAFVGTLIVKESQRNRGIGERLLMHAVMYLKGKGVRTIELDGVFEATPLYRRMGFVDKYLSLRFFRTPAGAPLITEPPVPAPSEEILDFDLHRTGIERQRIIRRYLDEYSNSAFVTRDRALSAYAFVRPRGGGTMAIGPFVAVDDRAAGHLMTGMVMKYSEVGLSVGVPDSKRSMITLLLNLGFKYHTPSLRMYLGDRKDYESHIYGILSPEKG